MSYQTALTNLTPFAAEKYVLVTPDGQEAVLVVVAATFEAAPGRALALASEQPPIRIEDVYAGAPGESSVLFEGELALEKPQVDVVVVGTAYAPGGRQTERVRVALQVGDIAKKLIVSGHRVWSGSKPSRPIAFTSMPVRYERAFGGASPKSGETFDQNPIGMGFERAASREDGRTQVPNVEYEAQQLDDPDGRVRPAGFGPIARAWQPRARMAGTFDDTWLQTRWPLLPLDFDARHNQCAPEDQRSTAIAGGEPVVLLNMTPEGEWRFRLPRLRVPAHVYFAGAENSSRLRVDTIVIEPDAHRVRMTARLLLRIDRGAGRLREIVLGHPSRAWLRARRERKVYVDWNGTQGRDFDAPCYEL